ncbi:sugar transferase [Methylobacterium sp. C25]|uniref:sugar transferase n=1 Tax=Methylobacterium sp. C25 TaxID=2721622 RepID=UPI001F31C515|nr:sugar transferase [Methylobacterium sp. C25]MCE4225061.1 sugar transferase [Methylobacterium sp. C25]
MIGNLEPEYVSSPLAPALDARTQQWVPKALQGSQQKRAIGHRVAKRGADVVLSLLGLLVLMPALVLVAALVRVTSKGPALFWQQRVGLNNKIFWCCKFRTHYAHCCDASGVRQTLLGDPRVTPLGRFLRRHSIDELPQLWNVLRGDMSLVGPRAHVADMLVCGVRFDQVVERYQDRHHVQPGITGLAQVRGFRGPVLDLDHARGRVECDLEYIEQSSLRLDLAIIARTLILEMSHGSGT